MRAVPEDGVEGNGLERVREAFRSVDRHRGPGPARDCSFSGAAGSVGSSRSPR